MTYYHSMPLFPRNIIQVSVAESIVHLKFKKGEYIFLNCSSYFYSQGSFGAREGLIKMYFVITNFISYPLVSLPFLPSLLLPKTIQTLKIIR